MINNIRPIYICNIIEYNEMLLVFNYTDSNNRNVHTFPTIIKPDEKTNTEDLSNILNEVFNLDINKSDLGKSNKHVIYGDMFISYYVKLNKINEIPENYKLVYPAELKLIDKFLSIYKTYRFKKIIF